VDNVLEIFKKITSIPRCSGTYEPFIDFVKEFSDKYDYKCYVDNFNNILCKKIDSKANLCLQNHYDIVCLVDNCIPKIVEEDGFLKAENSTLGADNGMGCSYMLSLMSQGYDLEYLFTSDEEIGLIGANNLEHKLQSEYMLNIDSEEEGEICIGCAGGVDIFGKNNFKSIIENRENYKLYEIEISKLPGGHSGVDIHLNVPNGIKLIAQTIKENDALLLDINGGERINSIPVNVKAIISCKSYPSKISHENICIKEIDTKSEHLNIWTSDIVDFIYTFANGVRAFDKELNVVLNSINLAKIKTNIDSVDIELSARSMDNKELEKKIIETSTLIDDVTNAAKEQTIGMTQIADAVGQLDQFTQENASIADKTNEIARETNNIAIQIVVNVDKNNFEGSNVKKVVQKRSTMSSNNSLTHKTPESKRSTSPRILQTTDRTITANKSNDNDEWESF